MADKFAEDQATLGLLSVEWMVEERERGSIRQKRRQDGYGHASAKMLDFRKHNGATFGYVYETDSSCSKWAARQENPFYEHARGFQKFRKSEISEAQNRREGENSSKGVSINLKNRSPENSKRHRHNKKNNRSEWKRRRCCVDRKVEKGNKRR